MSIDKIKPGDELSQSKDLIQQNIEKLKSLFPEIVTEGKIDFKVLQQVLGDEVEKEKEYYRFTWAGKSQARKEAHKPSTGTLRPKKEESLDWDKTQNIYIEGDNLEVLKLLQKSYAGKIKMIYIDPPYNTGNDFVYKDNYKDNLKNYQEITGQVNEEGAKLSTNSDTDGRYHSNWLNMIYPRLILAKNLLKEDGVIFISIDDNEVENLKKVCNEIFGEENFIGSLYWQQFHTVKNDAKNFSKNIENILVFGKRVDNKNIIKNEVFDKSEYYNRDDRDGKGKYKLDPLTAKSGTENNKKEFEFSNGIKWQPNSGTYWRYSFENLKKLEKENKIFFNSKNTPMYKRHLKDVQEGRKVSTLWLGNDVGYSITGDKEVKKIFQGKKLFTNPKPSKLIKRILEIGMNTDGICLDFFSGSSTSAHAVMELNLEDGGNRKYIMVQLSELTKEKDEAYKAGYKNIAEIGKERIRRVVKKIKEEHPQKSKEMDLGFQVFQLDSSNIKAWDGNPDNLEVSLLETTIKSERREDDILYEILLKYGLDLTLPIEERTIEGEKVFSVGLGSLFICLGNDITRKVAQKIGEWKEECMPEICRVVFKDGGFNDVEKTNSVQILKSFGIEEIKSI